MNENTKNINFLQRCPHLKSQWTQINSPAFHNCYQHVFSDDQSQAKFWRSVPMKEVDIYSSRQAYSFPFCPKIYKYIIEKNEQSGNRICFDLTVLFQRIINRLSNTFIRNATTQQIKFLTSRVDDIVKGFEYLYKRFGAFHITKEMIGWTDLGIIKVWINEDFSLNKKSFQISRMQDMVKSLTKILQECSLVKNKIISKCYTFESLLKNLKYPHERMSSQTVRQVAFKPIQSLSLTQQFYNDNKRQQDKINQDTKSASKKNITFSYSNKYINSKSSCNVRTHGHKRSSIKIQEDPKNISIFNRLSVNCNDNSIIHKSPTSSLKIIYPQNRRHLTTVVSHFYKENNQEKEQIHRNQVNIKKLEDHFCKTTVSSTKIKDCQNKQLISNSFNTHKPQTLHYSTSSNPCAKFMNLTATMGKAYSTVEGTLYQNVQEQQILKIPKRESNLSDLSEGGSTRIKEQGRFERITVQIEQKQEQGGMRQSQEIQKDLDALFHSENDFDYGELENQLDCIL